MNLRKKAFKLYIVVKIFYIVLIKNGEEYMKYKLIALDIDGTLINSSHQITDGVKEAIQKAKEKGVRWLCYYFQRCFSSR